MPDIVALPPRWYDKSVDLRRFRGRGRRIDGSDEARYGEVQDERRPCRPNPSCAGEMPPLSVLDPSLCPALPQFFLFVLLPRQKRPSETSGGGVPAQRDEKRE